MTSPVERISGPSTVSEPGKRRKGKTASLIACSGGLGSSCNPSCSRLRPAIRRLANLAKGTPVALATKGTVREARGLASMMYTSSWQTANCRLIKPCTCKERAKSALHWRIVARASGLRLTDGKQQAESPEWIPAGSMCSISPPITT